MDENNGLNQNTVENGLDRSNNKKSTRNKILIIILAIITAVAIGVTVWALFFRNTAPASNSDYAPQQVESNAEKIEEDNTEKLEQQQGGGAVSLTYSNTVNLSLSKKEAALMFQNPARSNQDMKLQILIDNKTIVESGRLEPGYKVKKLSGIDTDKLSTGTYEGKFVVSYYNVESGEKAVVNTEIPVTITVKD